jgi:hypothetical protein
MNIIYMKQLFNLAFLRSNALDAVKVQASYNRKDQSICPDLRTWFIIRLPFATSGYGIPQYADSINFTVNHVSIFQELCSKGTPC